MPDTEIKFEDGAAYERMMGVWSQLIGLEFLDWLSPPSDQRWVDIGCGNGAFSEQIVNVCNPRSVQGIDPSIAQIDFAKNRTGLTQEAFQIGDAMSLPYEDSQYDYATMALALFFVPNPKRAVSEMERVVVPDGVVAAYMWDMLGGGAPMEPIHAALRQKEISYPLPPSADISRLEKMRNLWDEAGFQSIETKVINVKRSFGDFDDFWNTTTSSPALTSVLKNLNVTTLNEIKNSTREILSINTGASVICNGSANCIKGIVKK